VENKIHQNAKYFETMSMKFFGLIICLFSSAVAAHARKVPVSLVYQFQNLSAWAENLAIRSNGKLLMTRTDVPELWSVNPTTKSATLVHNFSNVKGLTGITKVGSDSFAIAGSDINLSTTTVTPGSIKIYIVDFQGEHSVVEKAIPVTNARFANGLTTFNQLQNTILLADSFAGAIWKINIKTGEYSIAISDPTMRPNAQVPIGINGVKVLGNYIYWTNSAQKLLCRVHIDNEVRPLGAVEIVSTPDYFLDDFFLLDDGTAYAATNPANVILEINRKGSFEVVEGSLTSLEVAGATAVQILDCGSGEKILYVTTNGAKVAPVNGTITEPGKVVQIKLSG
jgi:hypothetical protein